MLQRLNFKKSLMKTKKLLTKKIIQRGLTSGGLCLLLPTGAIAQELAIHNNLLLSLAGDISIGVEVALRPRTTVELYGLVSPWKASDTQSDKHWILQTQYRFWTCQKFNGFYWGPYLHVGEYNQGNTGQPFGLLKGLKSKRYEGWMAGGGIGGGYQYAISRHWNAGAELGLGYTYFNYRKSDCEKCTMVSARESYHYWLFSKGSIYVSYLF